MHLHLVYLHKIIFIQEGIIMSLPLAGNPQKEETVTMQKLYEEVVEKYSNEDFFDVMFFGRLDFSAEKARLECERASLGDSLKATIKKLIPTKPNLSVSNDEIDNAIAEDMASGKGNIHTLGVYSNPKKEDLYKTIAYAYDKEIMLSKTPIDKWPSEMILTSPQQQERLKSRNSQIKTISALREKLKGVGETVLSFKIRWKIGGFQQINITVKPIVTNKAILNPTQIKYLDDLGRGVEVVETEMYNKSNSQGNKVYANVPDNTDKTEADTIIEIVNDTAQNVRKEIVEKFGSGSNRRLLVADAANAYNVGGDPLGGGTGQEESLIQSDPILYAKLSTALEDYYEDTTEIRDKIEKYKDRAVDALAQIEIYKDVEKGNLSDKLQAAISEKISERTPSLKKDGDKAEFISDLLSDSSFKFKRKLIEEIDKKRTHIDRSSSQVEKLAMDMLHRKSKNKIVMVPPTVDFGTSGGTSEVPELESGYAIFNAPDLRSIREYISAKVYDKLSNMIRSGSLAGEKDIEKAINTEAEIIKKSVQSKINARVRNSITYQMAEVCKKAKEKKYDYLILAAVGGGIFGCPPQEVAKAFRHVLVEKKYKNSFKKIVFAIFKNPKAIAAYERVFGVKAS